MNFKTVIEQTSLIRTAYRMIYQKVYHENIWGILKKEPESIVFVDDICIVHSAAQEMMFLISKDTLLYNQEDISNDVSERFILKTYNEMRAYHEFLDLINKSRKK